MSHVTCIRFDAASVRPADRNASPLRCDFVAAAPRRSRSVIEVIARSIARGLCDSCATRGARARIEHARRMRGAIDARASHPDRRRCALLRGHA